MIASVLVPLADVSFEPPEMMEDKVALEAPPVPCLGADACRGTDAGNTYATSIDITSDFDWTGQNETNTYYGTHTATSYYPYDQDAGNDFFTIDTPAGYGVEVTMSWNATSGATYPDAYAHRVSFGPTSAMGYSYGTSTAYGGAWGYCYYSAGYSFTMNTEVGNAGGASYCYWADSSFYSSYPQYVESFPIDLAGEEMMIIANCYYCYMNGNNDYTLEVTVFPADGGAAGDATQDVVDVILDMPDSPSMWSYQTDTFVLDGTTSVNLDVIGCDSWCSSESTMDVTKPDGTVDSFGYWAYGYTGTEATYSDAGTYTVEKMDSYGDGGFGVQVGSVIGSFTGILTGDAFDLDDSGSGMVGTTDSSDMWALVIPDGYEANITLEWEQSADLDLYVFSNADESGMIAYAWTGTPGEFIDLGGAVTDTTVYIKVDYYYGSSSWAGYSLLVQLSPSVPPPCAVQNDAGSGLDAADDDTTDPDASPMNLTSMGLSGTIQGMACDGYDDEDWYQFTVPAYHGLWARLDWTAGADGEDFSLYQYMDRGYPYTLSSSTIFNPEVVASNESYYWNVDIAQESTVWLRIMVSSLPDDVEHNYTLTWSVFNATIEPVESVYQNDAGLGIDAHDSAFSSAGASVIPSMNNTLTGYGHDSWDQYDMYEIYIPDGYALMVDLTFPEENDLELMIKYPSPYSATSLYTACSSYNNNPESCSVDYSYGGQPLWIVVTTDRGSGEYTMDITMITIYNQPGSSYDDCGMDGDAGDSLFNSPGATMLTTSTAINATGHSDDVGGTCTGWTDYTWDKYDYYHVYVPAGKYMWLNVTWDDASQGANSRLYSYMYKCAPQTMIDGICTGSQMYVSQEWDNDGDTTGNTGLWFTAGGYATIGIYGYPTLQSYGVEDLEYTMSIEFDDLSNIEGGVQDDGGSGVDAGATELEAVHVNDHNNMTNNTMYFEGWTHSSVDNTDRYTFDVPVNWGYEVTLRFDGINYYGSGYNIFMILDLYGSTATPMTGYNYGAPMYASNEISWNSTSTSADTDGAINMIGVRNWYSFFNFGEMDYNITLNFFSLDFDGDGWNDDVETQCGSDPLDATSVPDDTDADGICDPLDQDSDGDGVIDSEDDFPYDLNETSDSDGDGVGDNTDFDNDNDMWNDTDEFDCLTDPFDASSVPTDFDNDSICDIVDLDDDNDGYPDTVDLFPKNSTEWADNDGDMIGDNADLDDDNDGYEDLVEIDCMSDPMDLTIIPTDQDLDGICDALDNDIDGDGYDNDVDVFPQDPSEWADFDGDSIGDNTDLDDDNDLVLDVNDAFPYDSSETVDTDGDGVGDNADLNDDGDAWTDADELACGSDSLDATSFPNDFDADMVCDKVDTDDDGDGVADINDAFPYDANENADLDGDGVGDYSDTDDDGDGWADSVEPNCGTDPMDAFSVPADNDGDNDCDVTDGDDDNDGTIDIDDAFPLDPSEQIDLDGDGVGDNSDQDDDGDGWLDVQEMICVAAGGTGDARNANIMPTDNETNVGPDGEFGTEDDTLSPDGLCNAIDPDDDGDGYLDPVDENDIQPGEDAFKWDPTEQFDNDGNGVGDNGDPLTLLDDMQADPAPFIGIGAGVLLLAFLGNKARGGREEDEFSEDEDFTEEFMDEEDEDLEDLEV